MKVKISAKRIFAFVILITLFIFVMYAGTNSKQIASALKSTFEQETIVEDEQETVQNPITMKAVGAVPTVSNELEGVEFEKNVEWNDVEEGIARVDLVDYGISYSEPMDVLLVIDISKSMIFNSFASYGHSSPCMTASHWENGVHIGTEGKVDGCTDRLDVTQEILKIFAEDYFAKNEENRIGIVTFNNQASVLSDFVNDGDAINTAIDGITIADGVNVEAFFGETYYDKGFSKAVETINARSAETSDRKTSVIFLTDGEPSSGHSNCDTSVTTLKNAGIEIYTIGLGINETENTSACNLLQDYCTDSSTHYAVTDTRDGLETIYDNINNDMYFIGSNATITDIIDENWVYYTDENHVPSPTAPTVNGQTVTWTQSTIDSENWYTFYIKLKDNEAVEYQDGTWDTNDSATLNYTDVNGNNQTITLDNPSLTRKAVTVNYYIDGTTTKLKDSELIKYKRIDDTVTVTAPTIEGYNLTAGNEISIVVSEGTNEINFYYAPRTDITYTVEYYFNGTVDNNLTETITNQTYGTIISTYTDKVKTGYKLDYATVPFSLGIDDNLIKVYYITDEAQTKTLSYTVEYYKDGNLVPEDTQIVTQTVQYLESDTMLVDKTAINTENKYEGYRVDSIEPATIPDTVTSGDVIKVNYVKRTDITYTVEYYFDGKIDETLTETITGQTYGDTITTYPDKVKVGYVYESDTAPITLGVDNNVIKVYYAVDVYNAKKLTYTVEYYKVNELADTKTISTVVLITEADTIAVNADNIRKTYYGYKVSGITLNDATITAIPVEVVTGDVIKIYYDIDESQTKELSYTVEYYTENEVVETDTQTVTATVQVLQADTITVNKDDINLTDAYYGYKFSEITVDNVVVRELPDEVSTGSVIKVYYVIDESLTKDIVYTIEYYKDNVIVDEDTEIITKTVQVLQSDTINIDDSILDEDKYYGYKIDIENTILPNEVETGDVISIYYIVDESQTKELNYTVEYYTENKITDTEEITATVQVLQPDTIAVSKNNVDRVYYGYKLSEIKVNDTTVTDIPEEVTDGDVIRFYYVIDETQRKEISYTVEYYKDEVLVAEDIEVFTKDVQVLENELEVDKTAINTENKYEGFVHELNVPEIIPDVVEDGTVIKIYYITTPKIIIKYIDVATGEEKTAEIIVEGDLYEEYDLTGYKLEIEGYTLVEIPVMVGEFQKGTEEKIFYYAKNTEIIIKHLEKDDTPDDDTDNLVLAEEEVVAGYETKEYISEPKEIEGYTWVESVNAEGKMTVDVITVVHYYAQNTRIVVNYVDIKTDEIIETEYHEGKVGDEYTIVPKEIDGYALVERPENETVIMTKEEIVLTYYYEKLSEGVIEKHIDFKTGELLDNTLHTGSIGDEYTTSLKEFDGYDVITNEIYYEKYVEEHPEILEENDVTTLEELLEKLELNSEDDYIPENAEGIMTDEVIEVKYYYIRKTTVKVEYINKATGESLKESVDIDKEDDATEIIEGHEGDSYKTEAKEFDGYTFEEDSEGNVILPENAEGTMEVDTDEDGNVVTETVVTYYYYKKSDVKVIHIDVKTNEVIEEEIFTGYETKEYDVSNKNFEGYDVVEEMLPENSKDEMSEETIQVKYYYIRKTTVKVEYIDEITGETIEERIIEGHEGDSYTSEVKEFEGYDLIEEKMPKNSEGTMEVVTNDDGTVETTTYVRYYYVHESAGVRVEHLYIKTNELLEKPTFYTGHEGDSYKTNSKEFKGYNLVKTKLPENAEGKMTIEEIVVKYYYIKEARVIVRYVDNETDKVIKEDIIEGNEDDSYKIEPQNPDGYKVDNQVPENKEGTMTEEDIIVTYHCDKIKEEQPKPQPQPPAPKPQPKPPIITVIKPSNSGENNSTTNKTENVKTGDITPIIAIGVIVLIAGINIIQIIISKKKHKKINT